MAGKLRIDAAGRLTGPATIRYNTPWPCANGGPTLEPPMNGVVLHTEAGYETGTIATFNNPSRQASAHFSVGRDGAIHQYGPVTWEAWHAADANPMWFGVETEDCAHPEWPWTGAQLTALAQICEALSALPAMGFPLTAATPASLKGVAYHQMMPAWNPDGHNCPGPVRRAQIPEILRRAQILRRYGTYPQPEAPVTATGPASWDTADWKTWREHGTDLIVRDALWWLTMAAAGQATETMTELQAQRVTGAHAALLGAVAAGTAELTAAVAAIGGELGQELDPKTIIAGVLAGLTPAEIAVAVTQAMPRDLARQVVDAIADRLEPPAGT